MYYILWWTFLYFVQMRGILFPVTLMKCINVKIPFLKYIINKSWQTLKENYLSVSNFSLTISFISRLSSARIFENIFPQNFRHRWTIIFTCKILQLCSLILYRQGTLFPLLIMFKNVSYISIPQISFDNLTLSQYAGK